jgi:hypothetical protein
VAGGNAAFVVVMLALAAGSGGALADEAPAAGTLGRYEIARIDGGLEIAPGAGSGMGRLFVVAGAITLLAGLLLAARPATRGPSFVVVPVGLALLVAAGVMRLDDVRWRVGPQGLEREDAVGRRAHWPPDAIAGIEIQPRQQTGPEAKSPGLDRKWYVAIRGRDEALLARFFFTSEADARSLASRLAALTGRPLTESETPVR